MKKTIYREQGKKWCALELTLENGRLSITAMEGVIRGRWSNDDAKRENDKYYRVESCGQITDTLAKWFPEVKPFLKWHLNDMHAGCEHQDAEGWEERPIDPSKPCDVYGQHIPGTYTTTWNMLVWVSPKEHPAGLLGVPCATCGYKYGTAWTKRELPPEVIAWVESFNG